ncbi:EMILIN-3 [Bagarius yarrelli]|uniref:EMILIN-3 n=1 Tax=Bagarius yarrelli TaxID=175774 RepID=A0A556V6F8_BAGYA|nr:EMILIN-3 [Bagarius yarrelli]
MLWLDFSLLFMSVSIAVTNAFATFHPSPNRFSLYKSDANPYYSSGKPTARHKNHCAYVVEKSISYTVQDGAAPYVKAEYNKCGWGKKCPGLRYRMLYKPVFKVAYKTMTELEWRCCPGFTGVGCNMGPSTYGMKAMPPFKGHAPSYKGPMPSHKGLQSSSKGPQPPYEGNMSPFKGPMPAIKGRMPPFNDPVNAYEERMPFHEARKPIFQGTMSQPFYYRTHWNQPSNTIDEYPGPNAAPSYPETFESYHEPEKDHPETVLEQHSPVTKDQDSVHPMTDDHEPKTNYQDHTSDQQQSISQPKAKSSLEAQPSSGDSDLNQAVEENNVSHERLNQMEEDVQRLSLGLETLRAKVTGLEDHLRASLREDASRMLSTILSAASAPIAVASQDMTVGFGDLPGGPLDIEGSDAVGHFPNLAELAQKVEELRAEVLAKSTDLVGLKKTVLDHDGALQRLSAGAVNLTDPQQTLETLVETKLSKVKSAVLREFDKRAETAEKSCEDRAMEVHLQCKKQLIEEQEHLEQFINGSVTALKIELANLGHQGQNDVCCRAIAGTTERLVLLEQSMDGLNQSQVHLKVELGAHKDHVEGMIEGRLAYLESLLDTTERQQESAVGRTSDILENCLQEKMKELETRFFAAMEELGNATSSALVEYQSVPTIDREVRSLKKKVDVDLDLIQKQLDSLELLCTSSCVPQQVLTGYTAPLKTSEEKNNKTNENFNGQLDAQTERLDHLNATLNSLLTQLTRRQEENELQGEVTLLKVTMYSVNHTLNGLKDSFGKVVHKVGQANLTWQEREERLAQQVKGVVHLVGRQASMLGAGERRLTRLKGELQDLRRRLASELQTCRSTALGVQKEVTDVEGRVSRVEGQCGGLSRLSEDLDLIRGELDKHSDGYMYQVNNTLVNHSLQLSELRNELKHCTKTSGLTGEQFMTVSPLWEEQHTAEPLKPRGDQFLDPSQV